MYLETILIAAIIGIFVIVARRLPEVIASHTRQSSSSFKIGQSGESDSQHNTQGLEISDKAMRKISISQVFRSLLLPLTSVGKMFKRSKGVKKQEQLPSIPVSETSTYLFHPSFKREEAISEDQLLAEGDRYLEEGKLKEAERSFLRAVAKNPKNAKLYNRLGIIYLKQRNFRDTLEAFEAARDLDPTRASRHYNVALAAWELKNLPKAREAITNALALDPKTNKYHQLQELIEQM